MAGAVYFHTEASSGCVVSIRKITDGTSGVFPPYQVLFFFFFLIRPSSSSTTATDGRRYLFHIPTSKSYVHSSDVFRNEVKNEMDWKGLFLLKRWDYCNNKNFCYCEIKKQIYFMEYLIALSWPFILCPVFHPNVHEMSKISVLPLYLVWV
jgi:hypothetical protein